MIIRTSQRVQVEWCTGNKRLERPPNYEVPRDDPLRPGLGQGF